ncbi:MAG: PorV/PorQ family protein [candidate division Zixibacteria bacterium]|nr:PorV/PorQ family protein [candidate division Zixibacteria bacterium]
MVKKVFFIVWWLIWFPFSGSYAAKYAGEFLALGVGAKALGMGGAFVGVANDGTASYWNPSGLCQLDQKQLSLMHAETFGSLLNQDFIAFALPLEENLSNTTIAFSLLRLGGGGIKITGLADSNRVILLREESHADYAFLFSYSRPIRPNFFWGANLKLIYRHMVDNSAFGLGADLSFLAKPYPFLTLGANLMDITPTLLFYDNGTTETITPTTKFGFGINHQIKDFSFLFASDADVRYEGRKFSAQYWVGEVSWDMHYGIEIGYRKNLAARLGFDQGDFTAGAGFLIRQFGLDIAFLSHDQLDNTYRISLFVRL